MSESVDLPMGQSVRLSTHNFVTYSVPCTGTYRTELFLCFFLNSFDVNVCRYWLSKSPVLAQ
jgi:hypothetical protein